jgi:hypothetical protein
VRTRVAPHHFSPWRRTRRTPDAAPPALSRPQRGVGGLRGEAAALSSATAPAALAGSAQALATGSASAGPTSHGAGARRYAAAAAPPTAPYSFTPPGRHHLFVPGPTNVADRVMRAMTRQSGATRANADVTRRAPRHHATHKHSLSPAHPLRVCGAENHRDPHFAYLTNAVLSDLKPLFKTTTGQCFVFPGALRCAQHPASAHTLRARACATPATQRLD